MDPLARQTVRSEARRSRPYVVMTDALKDEIVERVETGEFLATVCRDAHMPSAGSVMRHVRLDDAFGKRFAAALATLADLRLTDAAEFAATEAGSDLEDRVERTRVAEIYAKTLANVLSKLAPKTHGELIKIAGGDGGAVQVAVVNYSPIVPIVVPVVSQ